MATTIFTLSTKGRKEEAREVLVRFYHGKKIDQRAKTGIYVNANYWNEKKQIINIPKIRLMGSEQREMIADLIEKNEQLEELRSYINKAFLSIQSAAIPKNWLSSVILDCFNIKTDSQQETSLDDYFNMFLASAKISDHRIDMYKSAWRIFLRYNYYYSLGLSLDTIKEETIRNFRSFLYSEHTYYTTKEAAGKIKIIFLDPKYEKAFNAVPGSKLPKARGGNSVIGIMKKINSFLNWAITNGYTNNTDFKKHKIGPEIYGTPYYLTLEERNIIYNWDFSNNPKLAAQRDIFIFQCLIGCRVSDLKRLKKDSVINGFIEYIPQKTKEMRADKVRVPLNSIAKEIIDKYADLPGSSLLPFICDQQYNYKIKDILKAAGIDRVVTILNPTTREEEKRPLYEIASSHLARRTFIGNLYNKVQDPNLIGKLTGHCEGSKAFARYREINDEISIKLVSMLE